MTGENMQKIIDLTQVLTEAVNHGASDLHLVVGQSPIMRLNGELINLDYQPIDEQTSHRLIRNILSERDCQQLSDGLSAIDGAFSLEGLGRFRINAYRQRGLISLALRILPSAPPKLEDLGLPEVLSELTLKHTGIILVTGPTGSGKSTSLAAMIERINQTQKKHIITVEDPIEYLHTPAQSIISQREIGRDTPSFAQALRSALRQDPDVILVGEMRDLETIQTALTAAETGHLVLSTLHTNGAVETIHRIIDVFPTHQQAQIRAQLAANIQGIMSQQLLPVVGGKGRQVATEVMIPTGAIRHLIREGKTHQIQNSITTGKAHQMHTMDMSLARLFQSGAISQDTLYDYAIDKKTIERILELSW